MTMDTPKTEGILTGPTGAGTLLRAARELQGLQIEMLATSLKVSVKKLEALEADRYDLLSDTVFVRALASSVCRTLKIDASPVLAALPRSELPRIKTDESGLNAVFSDPTPGMASFLLAQINRPLSIALALVIMGILTMFFWPLRTATPISRTVGMDQAQHQVMAEPVLPPKVDVNAQTVDSEQIKSGDISVGSTAPESSASIGRTSQVQKALIDSEASVESLPKKTIEAIEKSTDVLRLHARGSSWVEVIDALGTVQLRRIVNKDESVVVSGKLPLSVVLGRSDLIVVDVRGQAFDTTALAKNNVARFEVK